jgi:hydroxylamine reductase
MALPNFADAEMFCYQCEQTGHSTACLTRRGTCGKTPEVAAMQDALIHLTKGIGRYAHRAAGFGARDEEVDRFTLQALFLTVTNVNFDADDIQLWIQRAIDMRDRARELYLVAAEGSGRAPEELAGPATWRPDADLLAQARDFGILVRFQRQGPDITGLQELLTYGLKGLAAYAHHAQVLGQEDPAVYAFVHETLEFLSTHPAELDPLLKMVLRAGEVNLRVMELLDAANTGTYGHPTPTRVRRVPRPGKCILVSGHDLRDLELILEQTAGSGVDVYTHGEMLPAHGYPGLNRHPHLAGHWGGAWQKQQHEFADFPGSIVLTTNCLIEPRASYKSRLFTRSVVAWPGCVRIDGDDFTPAIEAALAAPGFTSGQVASIDLPDWTVGFGHDTVLGIADTVVDAVEKGDLRHFFLIGGCDGARPGRNYFEELATSVPDDCVILTLGCGKYRIHDHEYGTLGGLPRLMDVGQCNDAYSAIKIALSLAEALDCGVNDLPLTLVLSWFEQKAVAVLLTLLHLGITNIKLGPTLPAFVSPAALKVLVDTFQLAPTVDARGDLQAALA